MSREFEIIQLEMARDTFKKLPNRERHQLVGCMHAHNELATLNQILLFSLNDVGNGELHDDAHTVQLWSVMQILTGKLFETWNMIAERFLKANPVDPVIAGLSLPHQKSLGWLKAYFGEGKPNDTPLRTIRDKTAFHYDRLNLDEAANSLTMPESRVYLAQHPANGLYYVGSALVFRAVFSTIADQAMDTSAMNGDERMAAGVKITLQHVNEANLHLHNVLYEIIALLMEKAFGKPLATVEQLRIPVVGAPKPEEIVLPMFLDIGRGKGATQ